MAIKTARNKVTKKVETSMDTNMVKEATTKVNNFFIDTTEMIVEETIARTAAWQNVADKAIKGGFDLAEKQADITFKALETLKKQLKRGQKNFRERVSN